jgi:hypothetical protein
MTENADFFMPFIQNLFGFPEQILSNRNQVGFYFAAQSAQIKPPQAL